MIDRQAHNIKLKRTAKIVTPFAFRKSCATFVCRLTWCYVREAAKPVKVLVQSMLLSLCAIALMASAQTASERADEVNSFGTIAGTWSGTYDLKYVPDFLEGPEIEQIHARVELGVNEHRVYFSYNDDDQPDLVEGQVSLFEDQNGWIVHLQRSSGTWIEKYILTFTRTDADSAVSTITRTVHNWYLPEGTPDDAEHFEMFGRGNFERGT